MGKIELNNFAKLNDTRLHSLFHHEKIVGFNVAVNDVRAMHVIDDHQHLIGQHHDNEFIRIAERFLLVFIADIN